MLSKTVASRDWKVEKHILVIEFKKDGDIEIEGSVRKNIPSNTRAPYSLD